MFFHVLKHSAVLQRSLPPPGVRIVSFCYLFESPIISGFLRFPNGIFPGLRSTPGLIDQSTYQEGDCKGYARLHGVFRLVERFL